MQQEASTAGSGELQPNDIVFECPQCGKSLAIDVRGAGYIVKCPDCGTQMQVPGSDSTDEAAEQLGSGSPGDMAGQVGHLNRLLAQDRERFQQISGELALIQAALDRIVGLLEDANIDVSGRANEEDVE